MTARNHRPSRFPLVRVAALLIVVAAAGTISGSTGEPETMRPVSLPPAVPVAVLLPAGAVPLAPRGTFDVASAETPSYHQVLTRLRTVAGATDLDTLAVTAWQHAAPRPAR
ncbi:hypothetical protein [Amycolatopsis sp. WQ 127309]|uniref:hypothetical protein n=1 Tax=Amycolatopsis sp. WQ 127309 TaxID=2932773 RepID=UPI001FF1C3DE|nr:hypothetical protein [Amycolatopsis sp. WQ 127309]UOZ04089.1 hypothetical protein MUY22_35320 [Amycolatopsis sp. WQ 127309]